MARLVTVEKTAARACFAAVRRNDRDASIVDRLADQLADHGGRLALVEAAMRRSDNERAALSLRLDGLARRLDALERRESMVAAKRSLLRSHRAAPDKDADSGARDARVERARRRTHERRSLRSTALAISSAVFPSS